MLHIVQVSGYSRESLQNEYYGAVLYSHFGGYFIQLVINFFIYFALAICLDKLNLTFLQRPDDVEASDSGTVIQLGNY